jgi:DNA polymerase-3 subunit alpha
MIKNEFGQMIFNERDISDIIMQGIDMSDKTVLVEDINNLSDINNFLQHDTLELYKDNNLTIAEFDKINQRNWHMPIEYKELDIAKYILSLCNSEAELQRCGQELIMYQDRDLFDLLKYMKYLVDIIKKHNIIHGVGRGSSVSSYILYKLGVHKIDSMYYKLDVGEFLR